MRSYFSFIHMHVVMDILPPSRHGYLNSRCFYFDTHLVPFIGLPCSMRIICASLVTRDHSCLDFSFLVI